MCKLSIKFEMLCKKTKSLQLQSFGGVCAAGAGGTADKRGIGAVAARTVRAEQKARLPCGSLAHYLRLIV